MPVATPPEGGARQPPETLVRPALHASFDTVNQQLLRSYVLTSPSASIWTDARALMRVRLSIGRVCIRIGDEISKPHTDVDSADHTADIDHTHIR